MKKILLSILIFGLISCGGADALQYGADVNRGECASGYIRRGPGWCMASATPVLVLNASTTGCRNFDVTGLPANAKAVIFNYTIQVASSNAVGERAIGADLFAPAVNVQCNASEKVGRLALIGREQVAVALGNNINQSEGMIGPVYLGTAPNRFGAEIFGTAANFGVLLTIAGYVD